MVVVWMAIMVWQRLKAGADEKDLWTPWPPSPGNPLRDTKAYLHHALGQQRSLSTMCAWCHTKCQRVLQLSRLELLPESKLFWSWYSGMPTALLYCNSTMMPRPSRMCWSLGAGLLCWWVRYECTGTRGQDADSQVWEEGNMRTREEAEEGRVRKRRRKGREEEALDEESTTYEAGPFWTTFCKYFLDRWLEMCSLFKQNIPPKVVCRQGASVSAYVGLISAVQTLEQTQDFAYKPPSNKSYTWIEAAPKNWKIAHKPRLLYTTLRYAFLMLVFSWVKETAELVQYEALFLVHPFVNNFHKCCLKIRSRHSPWPLCLKICNLFRSGISCLEKKKHVTKMSNYRRHRSSSVEVKRSRILQNLSVTCHRHRHATQ